MTGLAPYLHYYIDSTGLAQSVSQSLQAHGFVVESGTDQALRPVFVSTQRNVEKAMIQALIENAAASVVCVIHTKLPPTPLRTEPSQPVEPPLVDQAIAADPVRLQTVTDRAVVLRELLNAGATLVATYPQTALASEIPGLDIYKRLLATYPNLVDRPLADSIPDALSGASCIVKLVTGDEVFFSIRAFQANQPSDTSFGLWLGDRATNAEVAARYAEVAHFFPATAVSEGSAHEHDGL
jgi:hypothetical protein